MKNRIHVLKTALIILGPAILLPSCSSVGGIAEVVENGATRLVANPNSYHHRDEKVSITLINKQESREGTRTKAAGGAGAVVVSYLAGEVIQGVKNASENFAMIYSGGVRGRSFENLDKFEVTRTVDGKPASSLQFEILEYDGTGYYYIRLTEASMRRAKAAIPFWSSKISLVIDIKVTIPGKGRDDFQLVVHPHPLKVKDLKIGTKGNTLKERVETGLFKKDRRPYLLSVTVQELSDYTKYAEKGARLISQNEDELRQKLGNLIGRN